MLRDVYFFFAVVGGVVFGVQFLMSLMALGGHRMSHRVAHHPAGHGPALPAHGVVAHRLGPPTRGAAPMTLAHASAATTLHARPGLARALGHRGAGGRAAARAARSGGAGGAGKNPVHAFTANTLHFLLVMLDFQALVTGATAFGLAGLASVAFGFHTGGSLGIAFVAGFLAMALVVALLETMENMDEEGTVHLDQAVGKIGTVYLSIPGQHAGLGKVMVAVQERSMELPAVTYQESPIATGTKVVVVDMEPPNVAQVMPADHIPGLEVQL